MRYQTSPNFALTFKALILVGGMATALFSLQGCIGDADGAGDQKEQARIKDKAPADTDGQVCAAVIVCGADGKIYATPCAAAAAKVEWSFDMGKCGEVRIDPIGPVDPIVRIDPILRCGNDTVPDVSIDPVIPPDGDDGEVCAAVMVCDDDGKQCHSLCDKTR
jgi:hypothetical protein